MSWTAEDWRENDDSFRDQAPSIWYPDPDWTEFGEAMHDYLQGRGLDYALAVDYGWYPSYYHGPRIIVPCIRTDAYNFWQGRLIDGIYSRGLEGESKEWKRWDSPSGPRGDALCFLPVEGSDALCIVEGPMDALAAAEVGVAAIAILGVTPPKSVVGHIVKLCGAGNYKTKVVIPDLDAIGSWSKLAFSLVTEGVNFELKIDARYKDLASMPRDERRWLFE